MRFHRWCRRWLQDRPAGRFGPFVDLIIAVWEFLTVVYAVFGVLRFMRLPAEFVPYLIDGQMVFGLVFVAAATPLLILNAFLRQFEEVSR